MPNISQSKGTQTIKFGQVIKHNKRTIFLHTQNEIGRLISDLFLFFKKTLYEVKPNGLQLRFTIFANRFDNLAFNENKLYKTLDYWSRDILNLDFLEKGLGLVSPPHFVRNFLRKIFFMLYSINWPNFIAWLLLCLAILINMCIAIFR